MLCSVVTRPSDVSYTVGEPRAVPDLFITLTYVALDYGPLTFLHIKRP